MNSNRNNINNKIVQGRENDSRAKWSPQSLTQPNHSHTSLAIPPCSGPASPNHSLCHSHWPKKPLLPGKHPPLPALAMMWGGVEQPLCPSLAPPSWFLQESTLPWPEPGHWLIYGLSHFQSIVHSWVWNAAADWKSHFKFNSCGSSCSSKYLCGSAICTNSITFCLLFKQLRYFLNLSENVTFSWLFLVACFQFSWLSVLLLITLLLIMCIHHIKPRNFSAILHRYFFLRYLHCLSPFHTFNSIESPYCYLSRFAFAISIYKANKIPRNHSDLSR